MVINIKKLYPNAIIPAHGSAGAAGYDLHACIDNSIRIAPGETVKISTGLSMAIPEGYFGGIFARSGLATKHGLRPPNCVGVIDEDYRGEVIAALHNDSEWHQTVHPGDRIAQLIVIPYLPLAFNEVDELPETERGEGGFGSTGK